MQLSSALSLLLSAVVSNTGHLFGCFYSSILTHMATLRYLLQICPILS